MELNIGVVILNIFAVITADVVDSKENEILKNKEWSNTKEYLDKKINELNLKLEMNNLGIFTRVTASRGDEIQVVCKDLKNLPVLIRWLRFYFLPLKLRVGIGIGSIEYFSSINNYNNNPLYNDSWDMNGEAFYLARKALNSLKEEKDITTCIRLEEEYSTIVLQTIYDLMDGYMRKWTKSQWMSIHAYSENDTYDYAAKELAISATGVYKNCYSANWKIVHKAEENLAYILDNLQSKIME